jgi:MFS family permease
VLYLLRQRNFALLWWGGLISYIGDWVLFVTLPLYVYTLTDSVLAMGAGFLVGRLPSILLGSVAGVFVDRWDRKWTLVVSSLLLAPLLLLLLFFRSPEQVWVVYLVVLISNVIRQFSTPAEDSLLPQLVGEEHLIVANALNSLNNNLARLIGPAVGGMVFAALGFSTAILLDVGSFVIASVLIALIVAPASVTRVQRVEPAEGVDAAGTSVWREWVDGLRVLRANRIVSSLFIILGISMLAEGILSVLIIVFVQAALRGGSVELGWLLTAQAVGGLLGGLLIGRIGKLVRPWQLVSMGFVLLGVIDFVIFNVPVLAVGLALMALVGLPATGLQAGAMTLFQTTVANEYRGRVLGAFGTTSSLLLIVGIIIASTLGNASNVVLFLSAVAALDVIAGVVAYFLLRESAPEAEVVRPHAELARNTTTD